MFLDYVLSVHRQDLLKVLQDTGLYNSYSINVDFLNLFEADPNTGDGVLCNSKTTLAKCDEDLVKAQKQILENDIERHINKLSVKQNVHARFFGLPVCPELHRITVPKNKDLGCFLKLTGTAIRVTQSKMLEYRRSYKCLKCHFIQMVDGKYEQRYVIKPPKKCKNPDMMCRSTNMSPINVVTRDNCKDYQELKIQEQVNKLTVGGIPGSIWVTLEDDLVDTCKPGDDVSICGTVLRRWNPLSLNKKCDVELVFKANHLEVCNAQKSIAVSIAPDVITDFDNFRNAHEKCPMKGRDVILASVCPKVYGLYMVKLALTLTVITGSSHCLDNDNVSPKKNSSFSEDQDRSVRGQCHLLLVGDPGTGKSQLLKASAMMLSRSVLTSGSGSTKAGLTCTALREDGEWQLEAGALVLADGGACCIDELAQMREHDRASIHEAMEQQTISVAKAGIICKLNTRCAVIAACNPKGNYDTEQALSVNVALGTPLLSRFDLIFILLDRQNEKWDNLVADYVLFGKTCDVNPRSWPLEKLQLYMSLIGPFEVKMSTEANIILRAYYVRQRGAENRDPSRTTVRMLDSLVRLSQAHARLMYRHKTITMDAITSVSLMDLSMQDCTLSNTSDALHSTFSQYPDFEYLKTAKNILSSLNLYEIWHNELESFSKLLNITPEQLERDIENGVIKNFAKNTSINETLNNTEEVVVESSFFQFQTKKTDDVPVENKTSKITTSKKIANSFLNDSDDDDLDAILNFECEPKKYKTSTTNGASEINSKTKSNYLLAQSIKKHSGLNQRNNCNMNGIIAGKRKRERNKNKSKDKTVKNKKVKIQTLNSKTNEENSDLQCVLNEINKSSNLKKKSVKADHIKGKAVKNGKISSPLDSSSDEDVNETVLFNCLPSVNDVFKDITMQFNVEKEDELSMFECSEPELDNSKSTRHEPVVETRVDLGDRNISIPNIAPLTENSTSKYCDPEPRDSKTSPVSMKTLQKLQLFSFASKRENAVINPESKNGDVILAAAETNASELARHQEVTPVKSKSSPLNQIISQKMSSNVSSQISIFENEDDFDILDL